MKRLLFASLIFVASCIVAWAANVYIGQLTADTSPSGTDIIETEKDPSGLPLSRKVQLTDAVRKAHGIAAVPGPVVLGTAGLMGTLANPGGDRFLGWYNGGSTMSWYSLGTGLSTTSAPALTLDATISGLANLNITQGSFIYGTGTDAYAVLAKGTALQTLRMNSAATAPEWASNLDGIIIGSTTPAAATFTTLSAGAAGFSVGAAGDTTVKSLTTTRVAGWASYDEYYEVPANGDNKITVKAPDSLSADYTLTWPAGTGTLVAEGVATGGVIFGTSTPNSAGKFGFDGTDKYSFFGNGEDFHIRPGTASNTTTFASSTGVDTVNMGSMKLVTTGAILGGINIISSGSTPYSLSAANAYGSAIFCSATQTINLPAGASGMAILVFNTGAYTLTIDPNGSEVIVRAGTTQTGGVSITLASGAGNWVSLIHNGTNWYTVGSQGTVAQGT